MAVQILIALRIYIDLQINSVRQGFPNWGLEPLGASKGTAEGLRVDEKQIIT